MNEPITERVPSLSALKAAVAILKDDVIRMNRDNDVLFSQVRLTIQKFQIVREVMDQLLGDQPPCPDGDFPELNNKEQGKCATP